MAARGELQSVTLDTMGSLGPFTLPRFLAGPVSGVVANEEARQSGMGVPVAYAGDGGEQSSVEVCDRLVPGIPDGPVSEVMNGELRRSA